ncbi:TIGR03899 family protein [Shewanella sp. JM162201]|uniref:TIGR03899 family protein n=1 Tax=Shewanella jiangmenensis TaxID=2837387 RepID=A0ABS5UZQ4_9GAMM|nr:TIGR03899 family protein [Shewanella jiangmenensis]MBT1443691.1 TIGR03899 family protein [Shewanella jiangmenensis]
MNAEQEAVVIDSSTKTDSEVSARRKALVIGRILGLAGEGDYKPSNVSVAERAAFRYRKLQAQYQANVEAIYAMAIKYTPSDVVGSDPDPDWLYQFFEMAEKIHNRRMQELWARILAKELTEPGNFSLRTLETLCRLTWREAQTLEKALAVALTIGNDGRLKLLSGYRLTGGFGQYFRKSPTTAMPLSQFGLPYSALVMLMDAGILHSSEFETGLLDPKQRFTLTLQKGELSLQPKSSHLLLSYYRFSPVGDELAQLVRPQGDTNFGNVLKGLLAKDFIVS